MLFISFFKHLVFAGKHSNTRTDYSQQILVPLDQLHEILHKGSNGAVHPFQLFQFVPLFSRRDRRNPQKYSWSDWFNNSLNESNQARLGRSSHWGDENANYRHPTQRFGVSLRRQHPSSLPGSCCLGPNAWNVPFNFARLVENSFNPLSPSIHIQILQTVLHTFP